MIEWRRHEEVYELTLASPPCNEIGLELLSALERFLDEVEPSDARAVVLASSLPRGFCAGADLRQLEAGIRGREAHEYLPELRAFLTRIHRVMDRFDALPQTTIAALHGVCFGGGFELALVCDLLVADRTTRFGFPELRLGIIPGFGGIPRLRREVPSAVIRDLLLTGRTLGAKRAHGLGLISQLVAAGEALNVARATAEQAARFAPHAVASAKRFIKPVPTEELIAEQELFLSLFADPVVQAALREFVTREDPMPYLPAQKGERS